MNFSQSKPFTDRRNRPRLESLGPHFEKLFLPDSWAPVHILRAPDTGPPHDHPYFMHDAKIMRGGYVENIWWPRPGGGYIMYKNVYRRPGTVHDIEADTIHLITGLLDGYSVTVPEPGVDEGRTWHFFLPQEDGSIQRGLGYQGPWEPWHPAGPVETVTCGPDLVRPIEGSFVIGPDNTWEQAWEALKAGHRVRKPDWNKLSLVLERNLRQLLMIGGATMAEWQREHTVVGVGATDMLYAHWEVLPKVDVEQPTV